jgi:hypothetical protein
MAATCTVTATITDPSGASLLGNALVRFRLRNYTGFVPVVSGTSVLCETQIDAYPNPAGAISQILTCNTAVSPPGTFYTCEFWNQGRPISSANYIFNSNTSLNTASNINPAPAPAGPSSIIFENNGVLNSSQTLLNLTSAQLTITDQGGGQIDIEPSSSGSPAGSNVLFIEDVENSSGFNQGTNNCVIVRVPASSIAATGSIVRVTLNFNTLGVSAAQLDCVLRRTLPGQTAFTDTTPITFSGTSTPVFTGSTLVYTSDPVSCTLDSGHDTYFIFKEIDGGFLGVPEMNIFKETCIAYCSGEVTDGVDYTTVSAIPNLGSLLGSISAQSALVSQVTVG